MDAPKQAMKQTSIALYSTSLLGSPERGMRTFVEAALACRPDRRRCGNQPRPRIPLEVRLMPRQVHHLVERHPGIGAARARNPQAERRVGHVVPARFADP